ncbi:dynamin family protein [Lentzea sp. NPDC005914]|uniref:dynamin family protein n=1 Tax=Lentzea sp. NPDC005914 TaxID=3154572 RepID=UPI0033ECE442
MTRSASQTTEMLGLIDAAVTRTRAAGRTDLADKLIGARRRLTSGSWHVLVVGEFKKGKSALVNGILGVEVCGTDAVEFTAVPTFVRSGPPAAAAVPDGDPRARNRIDIRAAAEYGLRGTAEDGSRLRAVEVSLSRAVLSDGLVLIDTPGLGGGFAAASAASTMRALAMADGLIVVTDASQELTATEVDFLRHAQQTCPSVLVALTKTDFYPHWRRILDLDRNHLRSAGIDAEVVAVSSTLRELALDTGDPALNAESGFPVLLDRLRTRLSGQHRRRSLAAAADATRSALASLAESLAIEHTALTRPQERTSTVRRVEAAGTRAQGFAAASARWMNTINDRVGDIRGKHRSDLVDCCRRLEAEAGRRIKEGDPTTEWAEIVPWLYRRANEELTDAHTRLIRSIDELARDIAAVFDDPADIVGFPAVPRRTWSVGQDIRLDALSSRKGGKLEVGMHAARGWSLSSSVVTTLLITTLHPGLLIALPVTAVLGSVFAIRAVRTYRVAKVDTARNEAVRAVATYLGQARADALDGGQEVIRLGHARVRDYYLDRTAELTAAAQHDRAVATSAATADDAEIAARAGAARSELDRVRFLLTATERLTGTST